MIKKTKKKFVNYTLYKLVSFMRKNIFFVVHNLTTKQFSVIIPKKKFLVLYAVNNIQIHKNYLTHLGDQNIKSIEELVCSNTYHDDMQGYGYITQYMALVDDILSLFWYCSFYNKNHCIDALYDACSYNKLSVVKLLMFCGVSVKEYANTLIYNVCWYGNTDIIELLLDEAKPDISDECNSLQRSTEFNKVGVVCMLLKKINFTNKVLLKCMKISKDNHNTHIKQMLGETLAKKYKEKINTTKSLKKNLCREISLLKK